MKPEQLYHSLKDLAGKLDITVSEQNFQKAGINVKSGLCTIRDQKMFIMDKHLTVPQKVRILAACLGKFPHEDIFVVPAVRELLIRHAKEE
jgi:hypothetical protein